MRLSNETTISLVVQSETLPGVSLTAIFNDEVGQFYKAPYLSFYKKGESDIVWDNDVYVADFVKYLKESKFNLDPTLGPVIDFLGDCHKVDADPKNMAQELVKCWDDIHQLLV